MTKFKKETFNIAMKDGKAESRKGYSIMKNVKGFTVKITLFKYGKSWMASEYFSGFAMAIGETREKATQKAIEKLTEDISALARAINPYKLINGNEIELSTLYGFDVSKMLPTVQDEQGFAVPIESMITVKPFKSKKINDLEKEADEREQDPNFKPSKMNECKYSLANIRLLELQGATLVKSFNQWKKEGYKVIKGSKALKILAPRTIAEFKVGEKTYTYKEFKELATKEQLQADKKDKKIGYTVVSVFDRSQVVKA